ncbi:MAG TPA: hypothetical protein VN796_12720 [Acidimicrobiales bacterium]|nr:hypothetical protein [Acidimicrobiales bacterium]
MIEIMSFRLVPGTDEDAFLAADRLLQSDFAYQQPGLLRRTTARSGDGDWIVIDLWRSVDDADAVAALWGRDPVTAGFMSFVDGDSLRVVRYSTLD